jgi:hypothetical protein
VTAREARELDEHLRRLQTQIDTHEHECKLLRQQPINAARLSLTTAQLCVFYGVLAGAIWWASGTTEQIKNAMLQAVQANSKIEALSQKLDNLFPRKR